MDIFFTLLFGPLAGLTLQLGYLVGTVLGGRLPELDSLWYFLIILGLISGQFFVARAIGKAASKKGRQKGPFFWVSFLLWPLGTLVMGIIVATVAPPATPQPESTTPSTT